MRKLDRRRLATIAALVLLAAGVWQLGGGVLIYGKAWLAQGLLRAAWAASDGETAGIRPWPWADTHPVGRLKVPDLAVDQIVLAGASGRNLAFGPVHLDGTAAPGRPGHGVLSGHRDTHFAFLADLVPGMALRLQDSDGAWQEYVVRGGEVIDARKARLTLYEGGAASLSLVTCYPFDAVQPGGPLRYVVFAEAVSGQDSG